MLAVIKEGDVKELAEVMRQDPGFKVNMDQNGSGWTLLHFTCLGSDKSAMIPLLLAHPNIDVNLKTKDGYTPFHYSCEYGRTPCVREMLKDSRVKVNEPSNDGYLPLWRAATCGHLDILMWWIASEREMDFGKPGDFKTDVIGVARKFGKTEVATLLERFKEKPDETRYVIRMELGWYDNLAAEMFALVVFVSDGLQ